MTTFRFGDFSISEEDWRFIRGVLGDRNVQTVLEFGSGYSTLLLAQECRLVVSYETEAKWAQEVKQLVKERLPRGMVDVNQWDGITGVAAGRRFDLAFVDGPHGGRNRRNSFFFASILSDLVLVHDAWRGYERRHARVFLLNQGFIKVSEGGAINEIRGADFGKRYCALWEQKSEGKRKKLELIRNRLL